MRTTTTLFIENPRLFKNRILDWANQFREVVYLDSNDYPQEYSSYDMILAVEAFTLIKTDYTDAFGKLSEYYHTTKDWLFGYLSYDLKNDTEKLFSQNFDELGFSDLFFFQPKKLFLLKGNSLEIQYLRMVDDEIESDFKEIVESHKVESQGTELEIGIKQRISKEKYLEKVSNVLEHIQKGDIYEANFCMEFYAENTQINPLETYRKLNRISESPFSAYFKNLNQYVLCSSPERYLRNENNKIISQPIKGTSKRFEDSELDNKSKTELVNNPKERSENIMIVDLVRNDLSRTAEKSSVKVEELCGVYSFKQVHQLISTITSIKNNKNTVIEVIKNSFPMGSMTGAPKISAMQIIENQEETKRGIYSGSIGYFEPNGNFDFNVVIRSILYNSDHNYLSFSVGSAITAKCNPQQEYNECLLKAKAMKEVLGS
ncbi:MAG: anthranilate synthase component I family protein [Weeksellaceae bacterium]|nr:anthranilate synthase component I family protein [Weeksellaceae bacterium]